MQFAVHDPHGRQDASGRRFPGNSVSIVLDTGIKGWHQPVRPEPGVRLLNRSGTIRTEQNSTETLHGAKFVDQTGWSSASTETIPSGIMERRGR
jgi:hypothetical protein